LLKVNLTVLHVHGYLFNDPTILIPDIIYNSPYLKIISANKKLLWW